jgi:AcrR family transcriptional regulator
MDKRPYHRGDLANKLIEAGIEVLGNEGIEGFSLRKVSARCGVSHAAAYAHFADLDALRRAMADHVVRRFTQRLDAARTGAADAQEALFRVGLAYIGFFRQHPAYFRFLFDHSGMELDLDGPGGSYPPFTVFRQTALEVFRAAGLAETEDNVHLMVLWAQVHGIVSLQINPGIRYSGDWAQVLQHTSLPRRNP